MKKIKIDQEIKDFNGNPVVMVANEPMTIRGALLQQVGVYRSADGKKTLEVYALGMKVMANKADPLELEDAEYELLKEVVSSNPAQMVVIAQAPVLMAINKAES